MHAVRGEKSSLVFKLIMKKKNLAYEINNFSEEKLQN